ncbi:hypothetical protein EKO27_g3092 [Xylaria grammica]|uniref:Proteasome endopeptidase complex n=1 Tax=Xylaria grammica TaxID=363999 RepID=A0A439DC71_9PEZI|nr:hypothetical protein EKO27_g3092 [Xylaria grammica]
MYAKEPHWNGISTLADAIRELGPVAYQTFPAHHFFARVYRPSAVWASLLNRQPTFLCNPEWTVVPWEHYPRTSLDDLLDVVVLLPSIYWRTDHIALLEANADRQMRARELLDNCINIEAQFDIWLSVVQQRTRLPYWAGDSEGAYIPFNEPLSFASPLLCMVHVYYWVVLIGFHQCVYALLELIREPGEKRPSPRTAAGLGLDPRKYQPTETRKLAALVCRSLDFALRTTAQPDLLVAPTWIVKDFYSRMNAIGLCELESLWVNDFVERREYYHTTRKKGEGGGGVVIGKKQHFYNVQHSIAYLVHVDNQLAKLGAPQLWLFESFVSSSSLVSFAHLPLQPRNRRHQPRAHFATSTLDFITQQKHPETPNSLPKWRQDMTELFQCLGTCAVGVKGKDIVVLGCEKRSAMKLQDTRITPSKIGLVDTHVCLAFAGLNADARILVDKARLEAQSHRLTVEDPVTIDYITKYVAGVQQRYTQSGGVRPFGISTMVVGFDKGSTVPRLYQTEPSGIYSAWKANAIGRSSKTVREFLERNYKDGMDREATIRLAIKSLLEVVQTGAKNIEIAIMAPGKTIEMLPVEDIETYVKTIEQEKQEEAAKKKTGRTPGTGSAAILTREREGGSD